MIDWSSCMCGANKLLPKIRKKEKKGREKNG